MVHAAGIRAQGGGLIFCDTLRQGEKTSAQGSEADTTNNRMELTAAVQGLQQLKRPTCVELVTDSVYVGTGLSDWLPKWKKAGLEKKRTGTPCGCKE